MIALKKIYGDELLRLALMLSLLKADPENYLRQEQQLSAGLNLSNGTDWSLEQESRTLLTPRFVHPKSLDIVLLNYEREVFEELNSLGRYHNPYSSFIEDASYQNNERILNLNSVGGQQTRLAGNVVHTYLVNNVATETVPALLDSVGSSVASLADASERTGLFETSQPYDHVSHDDNVAQEVRVSLSEDDTEGDDGETSAQLQTPDDVEAYEEESLPDLETVQPVRALPEPEVSNQSFNVSDFFVNTEGDRMPGGLGANGQDRTAVEVKKEKEDDLYDDGDDALDQFLPYFADKNQHYDPFADADSVFDQNMADLQDYDETLETLKEFKSNFEYLDVKQQQENLEQYLLENTPLEMEAYDLKPIFEDERFLLDLKLERAGTSFSSDASSSGVSGECDWSGAEIGADDALGAMETVSSVRVKVEVDDDDGNKGAELTQEDMDLIEVLWKQDVDMGFTLDGPVAVPVALPSESDLKKLQDPGSEKATETTKLPPESEGTELDDIASLKAKLLEDTDGAKKEDPWSGLSYTIDTETGEFVLQGELPGELVSESDAGSFDLLDEALQFVALDDRAERAEGERAADEPAPANGEPQDESIMRQMSAEQRWQDLASLLAMPPPPQAAAEPYAPPAAQPPATYHQLHHHAHHAHHPQQHPQPQPAPGLTPHAHLSGSGAYAAGYSPLAPPEKHDAVYGHPPVPLELPQPGYKQEAPPQHYQPGQEPLYYQNSSSDMNTTSDGLLSSILNDEDLQLMDMAMNEGMYTMRPLEGAGGAPQPPIGAPHAAGHPPTHLMLSSERVDSSSDSAVSSMGSERVPSLSDGEWCDGGSDSAQEYHSSKFRPYDSYAAARPTTGEERGAAPPPALVAQKKHHMFGKRAFQEQSNQPVETREPRMAEAVKFEYPETQHAGYHTQDAAIANELKYSCTLEFSTRQAPGYVPPRPAPHGEQRVRHNHTYSMPVGQLGAAERPQSRDKRARRLTDGSLSDCGSSPGGGNHLTRDEKRAKALGIPLNVQDIINLPMDEFNERLSKHDLSEAQLSLIRDIRRRGKNKVAAQNCRKRKLDQITSLADEVRTVRDRTTRLRRDQQSLLAERQRVKDRFATLYRHVFQNLRDADGTPLSSQQFSLQQAADGSVVLVPRAGSHSGLGLQAGGSGAEFVDRERHMNRTSDEELERKNKNYEQ